MYKHFTDKIKTPATAIFLVSFAYYLILCAKEYTWIFVSGDSGDWIAASQMWFVPQPMGSPLYILLGRFIELFPGDIVLKLTIILSVIPAAITVTVVYLISCKLTFNRLQQFIAPLVLLGSAVFLSQSTVLEEYALATMFAALAYYFYLSKHSKRAMLFLGLATAVHSMIFVIGLLWLVVERDRLSYWLKQSWVFILSGVLPYGLVPLLMVLGKPPLIAGYIGLDQIAQYWGGVSSAIVGQLAIWEFPERLGRGIAILLTTLGFGVVGLVFALKKPIDRPAWTLIVTCAFCLWYYLACLDGTTWTFLTFAMPSFALLCTIGAARLPAFNTKMVIAGALCLMLVNSIFLNASVLAEKSGQAEETYEFIRQLPSGSAVITTPGAYSLCIFRCISEGYDIIPIIWWDREKTGEVESYLDHTDWICKAHGVCADWPVDLAAVCLQQGRQVWLINDEWKLAGEDVGADNYNEFIHSMITEDTGRFRQVIEVDCFCED